MQGTRISAMQQVVSLEKDKDKEEGAKVALKARVSELEEEKETLSFRIQGLAKELEAAHDKVQQAEAGKLRAEAEAMNAIEAQVATDKKLSDLEAERKDLAKEVASLKERAVAPTMEPSAAREVERLEKALAEVKEEHVKEMSEVRKRGGDCKWT